MVRKESKWLTQYEGSSKRTNVYASGAYSSSSNLNTPSSYESLEATKESYCKGNLFISN